MKTINWNVTVCCPLVSCIVEIWPEKTIQNMLLFTISNVCKIPTYTALLLLLFYENSAPLNLELLK